MRSTRSHSLTTPKHTAPASNGGAITLVHAGLRGALVALIVLHLLTIAAAAIAYANPDPDALTAPLSLCVLALAPITGGAVAYRIGRRRGVRSRLLCGLVTGAILLICLFALSLCLPDSLSGQWPRAVSWGLRAGMLIFCILGAAMAAYAPRKRRKKRR